MASPEGRRLIHHASRNPTSPYRNSRSWDAHRRSWFVGAPLLLSHIFCPSSHFNPEKRQIRVLRSSFPPRRSVPDLFYFFVYDIQRSAAQLATVSVQSDEDKHRYVRLSVCVFVCGMYVCIYVCLYIVLPVYAGVCILSCSNC